MVLPHSLEDVRQALCELGHVVFFQDLVEIERNSPALHALDLAIIDGLIHIEPDYVVTVDSAGLIPEYLAVLEPRCKYVSWFFDDPLQNFAAKGMDFSLIAPDYHVFSWDRAYLGALREMGLGHCDHMPFGTNPRVHYPRAPGQYSYDVSFVGHWTTERMALIETLAQAGVCVDVFGDPAWRNLGHPGVRFHGHAGNREAVPEIYSRSRINLNITNAQLLSSLPVRIFDVLACAGFLLTDLRQDLSELFEPGEHLALYTGAADLVRQVRSYLDRPGERERIGAAGRQRVQERFTFRTLLAQILERVASSSELPRRPGLPEPQALLALWLSGLGYLKFGRYPQAERQLLRAHALEPKEPSVLLALAALAHQRHHPGELAGWTDRLRETDPELARCGRELLAATEAGQTLACWDLLYRDLGTPELAADGTVAGWEPRRVREG